MPPSQQADSAQRAAFHQLLDLGVGRVVPHLVRHHELDAGPLRRFCHAVAVCQGQRHGFLA